VLCETCSHKSMELTVDFDLLLVLRKGLNLRPELAYFSCNFARILPNLCFLFPAEKLGTVRPGRVAQAKATGILYKSVAAKQLLQQGMKKPSRAPPHSHMHEPSLNYKH
jgi:hypothetical protein